MLTMSLGEGVLEAALDASCGTDFDSAEVALLVYVGRRGDWHKRLYGLMFAAVDSGIPEVRQTIHSEFPEVAAAIDALESGELRTRVCALVASRLIDGET